MTRWLLICGTTERELAGCHAETLAEAVRALDAEQLRAPPDSFVVSSLSWDLGTVRPQRPVGSPFDVPPGRRQSPAARAKISASLLRRMAERRSA